jgi:hypothetical protein
MPRPLKGQCETVYPFLSTARTCEAGNTLGPRCDDHTGSPARDCGRLFGKIPDGFEGQLVARDSGQVENPGVRTTGSGDVAERGIHFTGRRISQGSRHRDAQY